MLSFIDGKWVEKSVSGAVTGDTEELDDAGETGSESADGTRGAQGVDGVVSAEDDAGDGEAVEGAQGDGEGAEVGADDGEGAGDDSGGEAAGDGAADKSGDDKARDQSKDERARQAEGRRRREAAIAEARRLADAEIAAALAALDLRDDAGETIATPEQARAYAAKKRLEKFNANLRSGELSFDDLTLLQGQTQAQTVAGAAQQAPKAPEAPEAIAAAIAEQLTRIAREFNADIKSVDDILAMDTQDDFRRHVAAGSDFYNAYRLANMEAITEAKVTAKLRQQQQNTASKAHLRASKGKTGDTLLTPPSDVETTYRAFFPEATDDEIARVYTSRVKAAQTANKRKVV
ncbi:MAG: hypothetical protein LBS51_08560 [Oscillospiraceae bacterium]|jgi:hypothetical protein|nr:hypothetical protein [Oscillospiraceae bacterium]